LKPPSRESVSLMDVYWLEQVEGDVPTENDWLGAREQVSLNGLRFAKRRADWRLGRWTAKRALASCLGLPSNPHVLARIEILPAQSGVPEVFLAGKPLAMNVSLSHRAGRAVCAVAPSGVELGCDLELIEPRSDAFISDYFTAEEQSRVSQASAAHRSRLVALLWSAKESTLKALHTGLRLDTRSVSVLPDSALFDRNGWTPLQVRYTDGQVFHGWWQQTDNILRTVVADSPPNPPISLEVPAYRPDRASQCA
jgi:4'-phosphopantetheinyl transferase